MATQSPIDRLTEFCVKGTLLAFLFYIAFRSDSRYPFNTFLFRPDERFGDFYKNYAQWNLRYGAASLDYVRAETGPSLQPIWDLTSFIFGLIPGEKTAIVIYEICSLVSLVIAFYWSLKKVSPNLKNLLIKVSALICFSYPVIFCLDRGNLEWLSAVFLMLALVTDSDKPKISSIALALSICVKPWAAFVLPWYLIKRRWADFARVMSVCASLMLVVSLFIRRFYGISPLDKPFATFENYLGYQNKMVDNNFGLPFGHSLFGLVKYILYRTINEIPDWFTFAYLLFAVGFLGFLLYLNLRLRVSGIDAYYPLIIASCLLPWVSADYKLLNIMACGMLVHGVRLTATSLIQKINLIFFALLLVPKSFISLGNSSPHIDSSVSISILVTPIILMLLIALHYMVIIEHEKTTL